MAPAKDALGEDVNEEGMVVELNYRSFRGLFTGDAGEPTEKAILSRLRDVDFLKVGHHGSRYSSCQEFLDQVKAEIAVISCSDSNTYGHPSPETTLRLEKIRDKNRIYHRKTGNHCVHRRNENVDRKICK